MKTKLPTGGFSFGVHMLKVGDIVFNRDGTLQGTIAHVTENEVCVEWDTGNLQIVDIDSDLIRIPFAVHGSGWVNIFRTVNNEQRSYYLGSEIFPTKEAGVLAAKLIRVPNAYVDTVHLEWEDRSNA